MKVGTDILLRRAATLCLQAEDEIDAGAAEWLRQEAGARFAHAQKLGNAEAGGSGGVILWQQLARHDDRQAIRNHHAGDAQMQTVKELHINDSGVFFPFVEDGAGGLGEAAWTPMPRSQEACLKCAETER